MTSDSNQSIPETLRNVALETNGRTIGPMPVRDFLDKFLPHVQRPNTRIRRDSCNHIPTRRRYKPFVSSFNLSFTVL